MKTDEISSVFNLKNQVNGNFIRIRFKQNSLLTGRIAVIVSKKIVRYAVERNYCKRVVREYFRTNQYQLQHLDLIVQIRSNFQKKQFVFVLQELDFLLSKLKIKLALMQ